jgi:alginate O-acetyltransferase complex protein AlgI
LFLFLFLPVVLAGYYAGPRPLRNAWLLITSLLFYGWGGPPILLLLGVSIGLNYGLGLWVARVRDTRAARYVLTAAVVMNLVPLAYYKYAPFFCRAASALLEPLGFAAMPEIEVALPIGISFFTFQAMSYVIDVYRREVPAARSPIDVALYIVFFPQLIAGPIVRYHDVAEQIRARRDCRPAGCKRSRETKPTARYATAARTR